MNDIIIGVAIAVTLGTFILLILWAAFGVFVALLQLLICLIEWILKKRRYKRIAKQYVAEGKIWASKEEYNLYRVKNERGIIF